MASRFLTANRGDELLWACVDEKSLCTAPAIAERRFTAYLTPFQSEEVALLALIDAGGETVAAEARTKGRGKRRRG